MLSVTEIVGLALSGAAAGAINAVAGGGTLVTFPTLLWFGTPPIVANATSTLALVVGTAGSVYGYRHHLESARAYLRRFIPVSLMGGLAGSILLTYTSERTFSKLVPFLILFATILFLSQGLMRRLATRMAGGTEHSHLPPAGTHEFSYRVGSAIAFQFGVALYGGYFGAGIGILMLASLGFIGLSNIHEMNTVKTILGSLINLVATVWFIWAGLIHWPKAGVITCGALAGYYLGSHYAQRISQVRVRQIITVIGFMLSAVTFYEEFLK
jgi:uncharacterized membrane protein YfcA